MASSTSASASSSSDAPTRKPTVIITIGMAGAGKSTFVQRINSHLHAKDTPPYILNLDPAITHSPFDANIDIRDTVDYKQVMKQCVFLQSRVCRALLTALRYNLGPNGGILTALNLFTTKFDQVLDLVEKRSQSVE
jgi:GTPase SAR1 family protein